jgi:hypothetical protein
MRLESYADVFTPDHPQYQAYLRGEKKGPGVLLADVLHETGGAYEVTVILPQKFLRRIAATAAETGDVELAAAAGSERFVVSLEHLRGLDPATTRIVYGTRFDERPEQA